MAGRSLQEVLADPVVLKELAERPGTFKFREAVNMVITVRTGKYADLLIDPSSPNGIKVTGPLGNLLEYMSKSMNFSYTLIQPPDRGIGSMLPNGTWTGIVGQVKDKVADIGLESMKMIPERREVVDFGDTLSYVYMQVLAGKGSPTLNPMGFLYPLSHWVWAAVLGALITVWAVAVVLGDPAMGERRNTWAAKLFYIYYGVLMQQSMVLHIIRGTQRVILGSWMLVAMILVCSYSSNLVSLLAARQVPAPYQTLRDVIDSDVKIETSRFTAFTHTLDHADSGIFKEIADLRKKGRFVYSTSGDSQQTYERLRGGDYVQMTLDISALQSISDDFSSTGRCDFYTSRETFLPGPTSIILQHDTPILEAVNARIRRVVYSGLFDHWVAQSTVNATICTKVSNKITVMEPLSIKSVSGMLVMWACGLLLSLAAFWVELLSAKLTRENGM